MIYLGLLMMTFVAFWYKALTFNGTIAAFLMGAVIFYSFSVPGLLVLIVFFMTSTLLGRLPARTFTREKEQRTAAQVFANGGIAAICAALYPLLGEIVVLMFIASLAAATSDTWATELGRRFGGKPLHLRKYTKEVNGVSGAISIAGTTAALFGSFIISTVGLLLFNQDLTHLLLLTVAGFIGSLADTVLGAFVQEERQCPICGERTEDVKHCKGATNHIRGIPFIGNNIVNTACTLTAALFVIALV